MEKVELEFKGKKYTVYDSFDEKRLDEETYEEYKVRQKILSDLKRARKQMRRMTHISTSYIPAVSEENKIIKVNGKILWLGKTKGKSYVKSKYTLEKPEELKIGDVYVTVRKSGFEEENVVTSVEQAEELLKNDNIKIRKYESGTVEKL